VLAPGGVSAREREILGEAGIAVFTDTVTCVSAIKPLLELVSRPPVARAEPPRAVEVLPAGVMAEREGLELLARFDIPAVVPYVVATATEATATASEIGYPVVMKAITDRVAHKAAAGLVRLALASAADVEAAFTSLGQRL